MWFAEAMGASTSSPGSGPETGVVARAHALIERGERWRARDLLAEHLDGNDPDPEALFLLGEVLHSMGDLPAAGAVWFGAGVKGPEVEAAVSAWRERYDDDFVRMWRTLPRSVRAEPRALRVEALRARALEAEAGADDEDGANGGGGLDGASLIAWIVAVVFVVCAVIGLIQILQWMVPGG
jgi:hypothetical protein